MKIRRGDINVLPFFGRPTSSSGVTERPRDALCQLKPCEMLHFNKNALQWANDHSKSVEMARINRPCGKR